MQGAKLTFPGLEFGVECKDLSFGLLSAPVVSLGCDSSCTCIHVYACTSRNMISLSCNCHSAEHCYTLSFCCDDRCTTYSLHCSSFFWFNQIYNEDPYKATPKRNYNGDYR